MENIFGWPLRAVLLITTVSLFDSSSSIAQQKSEAQSTTIRDSLKRTLQSLSSTIHRLDSLSKWSRQDADGRMRQASTKLKDLELSTDSGRAAAFEFVFALVDQTDCTLSSLKWSATSMSKEIEKLEHTLESLEKKRNIASTESNGIDLALHPLRIHQSAVPEQIGTGIIPSLETMNDWQRENEIEQEQGLIVRVWPVDKPSALRGW